MTTDKARRAGEGARGLQEMSCVWRSDSEERAMAKKTRKPRLLWTKEDIRMLKTLVREKEKTSVIARKLKRTLRATQQKAFTLGVRLGRSQQKKKT